ncbi:CBS domain-containing protein [Ramlibacter sp.]|uniref:CBS domain-containing protein n=1 Tax=Ramlibacter sp. TaxID=1917967 RepID=UPI002CB5B340|nr:CBS domain-containing protein [Ramlibacter sp.]HWI82213.1 CBS domain-containing protein [Ramlibacter sp.]
MSSYPALASRTALRGPVRLCRLTDDQPRTAMDSPALQVMTDLTRVAAAVASPATTVDEANHSMMRRGVRMLLVLDDQELLAGIVTATDLMGEKPVTLARERGVRHAAILVADVMTPTQRLDAFELRSVQHALVGHVVASLQQKRRHHALVTQPDGNGGLEVRGIFSLSQIARQLGTPLELPDAADSFAEIEAALAH